MDKKIKDHYFVNWVDGMKINKSHFQDSDKATIAIVTKAASLAVTPNHYGLLPLTNGHHQSNSISLSIDGQDTVLATINRCKAVTSGGYYIDISAETNAIMGLSGEFTKVATEIKNKNDNSEYYIVLNMNPYDPTPIGEAQENEEPLRHPYLFASYTLSAIEEGKINDIAIGEQFLVIGKMTFTNGSPELIDDFIPPCYSVQSHQDIVYIYTEIGVFFNAIEKYCLQIVQKIFQKKQTNELAHMVLSISQNVWQFIAANMAQYRIEDKDATPLRMVTQLMSLARVVKNSIDVYTGTGKEELVNYLTSWSDKTQGNFEEKLSNMINLEYKHYDMNLSLNTVADFSKIMLSLFKKLDDLDYIGKKSDSNIFVKEEVVAKKDVKERRRFLLD